MRGRMSEKTDTPEEFVSQSRKGFAQTSPRPSELILCRDNPIPGKDGQYPAGCFVAFVPTSSVVEIASEGAQVLLVDIEQPGYGVVFFSCFLDFFSLPVDTVTGLSSAALPGFHSRESLCASAIC